MYAKIFQGMHITVLIDFLFFFIFWNYAACFVMIFVIDGKHHVPLNQHVYFFSTHKRYYMRNNKTTYQRNKNKNRQICKMHPTTNEKSKLKLKREK